MHHSQDIEYFHLQKVPLCPFPVNPYTCFLTQPQGTSTFARSRILYKWNIQYGHFRVWCLFLDVAFVRFFQGIIYIKYRVLFFLLVSNIPLYVGATDCSPLPYRWTFRFSPVLMKRWWTFTFKWERDCWIVR